jgi:hypothetical protein
MTDPLCWGRQAGDIREGRTDHLVTSVVGGVQHWAKVQSGVRLMQHAAK